MMPTRSHSELLGYYRQPGTMTDVGSAAELIEHLPHDVGALAEVLHGLILHEHIAPAYGVTLADDRRREVHIRTAAQRLKLLHERDPQPLDCPRAPEERSIGNCRHYSVLLVAILRAQSVPARARCGFAAYFEPGRFVDHWVCECWNETESRWVRADAQIDGIQRGLFHPDFDLLDVPRDRFLIAGDAWLRCRSGEADPSRFGILDMSGMWFIAGNLLRDFASLNNMEMLPWDVWGAMVQPGEELDDSALAFFDRIAALTREPDAHFAELRDLYQTDSRLRVPETVFNAVLNQTEAA